MVDRELKIWNVKKVTFAKLSLNAKFWKKGCLKKKNVKFKNWVEPYSPKYKKMRIQNIDFDCTKK